MTARQSLQLWHDILRRGDLGRLDEILAADCVFVSPLVHTPQEGRELTRLYLSGAYRVLVANGSFRYLREEVEGNNAVLEFVCEIDGISVNGVDIMSFDEAGRIREFKVMVRPLKAINVLHRRMQEILQELSA